MNSRSVGQSGLLVAALVLAGTILFLSTRDQLPGAVGWTYRGDPVSLGHAAGTAIAILAGIALGIIVPHLLEARKQTLAAMVRSNKTALAVVAAPIVFIYVFDQVYEQAGDLHAYVFALQNGFFFRTILATLTRGGSTTVTG